jgi:hypothetical protein
MAKSGELGNMKKSSFSKAALKKGAFITLPHVKNTRRL